MALLSAATSARRNEMPRSSASLMQRPSNPVPTPRPRATGSTAQQIEFKSMVAGSETSQKVVGEANHFPVQFGDEGVVSARFQYAADLFKVEGLAECGRGDSRNRLGIIRTRGTDGRTH